MYPMLVRPGNGIAASVLEDMRPQIRQRLHTDSRGFTLIDSLVATGLIGILAAMTVPTVTSAMRMNAISSAGQMVAATIRSARYTAISASRTVRVRFNCPSAGAFRVVETIGTAADNAANRCNNAAYPFPDVNAQTVPDVDGPVLHLPGGTNFATAQDLEIDSNGRVTRLIGCPACAAGSGSATAIVTDGGLTRTVTVTQNGRISIQ
jgi:type II secretory pathway pseudopilin PulG